MKRTLITEIRRQLELMSVNPKPKLLMEDGVLRTVIDMISKKLSTASPLPPEGVNKISPGVKLPDGGVNLKNQELTDITDLLSDWEVNKQYLSISPEYIDKFRVIILSDENIKKEIFGSMIDDITREIGSAYGRTFQSDVEMYDLLKRMFPNIEDIKSIVKNSNPNPGDDPLVDIFYDVLAESIYNNAKKMSKGTKVESAFNEITNSLTDINRWDQISIAPLDERTMRMISSSLTPTVRESISNWFRVFNKSEEFENLGRIMKRIDNETDPVRQAQLKKYVVKEYSHIFINNRKVFEELNVWINSILDNRKDITPELEKTFSEIKTAINNKDYSAIKILSQSDGTLNKLSKSFKTTWSDLGGGHLLKPFNDGLIGSLFKSVRSLRTKDEALKKEIKEELKKNWENSLRLMKSGSLKGFPGSKLWDESTGMNASLAKKRYFVEVYGRRIKLYFTIAALNSVIKSMQSYYTSLINKDELNACKVFLDNPENKKKINSGTLTDSELESSKCTFDILMAIRSQYKGGWNTFLDEATPDFELTLEGVLGTLTFLIPGLVDDILYNGISAYFAGYDPDSPEYAKNLMKQYTDELQRLNAEIQPTENNNTGNTQDEKYSNDIDGFKLYLKDVEMPLQNPKKQGDVFLNGIQSIDKYEFVDSNRDNKGKFKYIEEY